MECSHWRALRRFSCLWAISLSLSVSLFAASRQVIIDNPKVRVLHIVIEPGDTTEIGSQDRERVVVWLQQGSAEAILPGGHSVSNSWEQNEVKLERPGPSRPMRLKGSRPVGAIVVELKGKGDVRRAPTSPQNPWIIDARHYRMEFENSDVRVTRVKIGPHEGTPLHEHSLDRVVVYLTGMDFRVTPEGKGPEHEVQRAGAAAWGTPVRHAEYNLSNRGFEAVVIEPKY